MRITVGQLRSIVKRAVIQEAMMQTRPGVYEDEDTAVGFDPEVAMDLANRAARALITLGDAARHPELAAASSTLRDIHRHLAAASLATERALNQPGSDHEGDISSAQLSAGKAHDLSLSLRRRVQSPTVDNLISLLNDLRGSLSLDPEPREDVPTADLGDLYEPL